MGPKIGNVVSLETSSGEVVQRAQVFGYDEQHSMLILKEPGAHHGVNNVRILNSKNIARMLSDEPPSQPYDPHLPAINLEKCKLREKKALEQAAQQAKRVNSGVTTEAQCIFEALNKTLPCEWQDKTIVVLDEVEVHEPYVPEACSVRDGGKRSTQNGILARVQLIIKAERKRLGLAEQ
uniref:AD domain-containing protein n=1 Tax=Dunaliella tertiolecta TaxID=3047 RepID=A0A7S3VM10_DUNTE|mmetsp:Transcript_19287/g.54003  ORF Transcript_19287/g.54003 Transcript_19287/m.54003 type:complete len:179 (+) Transcript_19287:165-701(+)